MSAVFVDFLAIGVVIATVGWCASELLATTTLCAGIACMKVSWSNCAWHGLEMMRFAMQVLGK